MGVLSKYYDKGLSLTDGIHVNATNAAYGAALVYLIGGVAYPRWKSFCNSSKSKSVKPKPGNDKDEKKQKLGPAVNRQFFEQLKKLIKVHYSC